MFRLTVVYPAAPATHFNFDYYAKTHMPLVAGLIGESVVRTEVVKGLAGYGGSPAPYTAIGHIYLKDLAGFQEAFANHGIQIENDVPNYTDIVPVVNIEEIVS